MNSVLTKIFKSNRSQVVRLPKNVAFPESVKEVEITAIGNKRIIAPADQSWDEWFDAPGVSSDFMTNRPQQVRRRFKQHKDQMCISSVTLGELIFGAEHSQHVERNLADIDELRMNGEGILHGFAPYNWLRLARHPFIMGDP